MGSDSMKLRKRNFKKLSSNQDFWPSFTDVMSTIALILFFLMLLAYIQNIITGSNLELAKKQLETARLEIKKAERDLRKIRDEYERTREEVELSRKALELSEKEIERQKEIIAISNYELEKLRAELQNIAVLRLDILKKVKSSVEKEIGRTNKEGEELVTIGDNANIIINESLVFPYNSYEIKPEGKELLKHLAVAFEKILDDENIRSNIDAINVEGHTDSRGTAEYNRDLSVKRSTAVVNYLMRANPGLEEKYGRYFAATGFSEFRPIAVEYTEKDREKNRRIEISIIVKDSNIQSVIEKYLEDTEEMFEGR
jgi:chemotaxis protein MotB